MEKIASEANVLIIDPFDWSHNPARTVKDNIEDYQIAFEEAFNQLEDSNHADIL